MIIRIRMGLLLFSIVMFALAMSIWLFVAVLLGRGFFLPFVHYERTSTQPDCQSYSNRNFFSLTHEDS